MRSTPRIIALGLFALIVVVAIAPLRHPPHAEAGGSFSITVEPALPSEADVIEITVEGSLPNSEACYDISSFHAVVGDTIQITVLVDQVQPVCMPVLGFFSATEEIGPLAVGVYQVQAYATECVPPCGGTATFEVVSTSVGGIAAPPAGAAASADDSGAESRAIVGLAAGVATGIVAMGGAAWYRWRRRS